MTDTALVKSSASVDINAAKLRELRQDRGYKQTVLAALCDITPQYLSQLETGARVRCAPDIFVRLCDALGIPSDERRTLRKLRPEVA